LPRLKVPEKMEKRKQEHKVSVSRAKYYYDSHLVPPTNRNRATSSTKTYARLRLFV
jgi:hypothetical protein